MWKILMGFLFLYKKGMVWKQKKTTQNLSKERKLSNEEITSLKKVVFLFLQKNS